MRKRWRVCRSDCVSRVDPSHLSIICALLTSLIFVLLSPAEIVARPNEDEKAIGLMRLLDDALGPRRYGPGKYTKEMYNQS